MAFSQSLSSSLRKTGQTAMMCQLCENDPKLKWKCLECELMMCQRCRDKVHTKFPSSEDHIIIDIKEVGKRTDSETKPDLTKMKCEVHSGQYVCLYCQTCQELVCKTCITKTHNKHEFADISDEYKVKLEKIRKEQKIIERGMETLHESEQKLGQIKSNEQSNYDKVKQEILDYDKILVNEIKKHTNKLLKELDQKRESYSKSVEIERKMLKEKQYQAQKQYEKLNDILKPGSAEDLFYVTDSWIKSLEIKITPVCTFECAPNFTHGNKTHISLTLGKLEAGSNSDNTGLKVVAKFKTDFKHITNVVSNHDGTIWINDSDSTVIQRVQLNGNNLTVISNLQKKVYDAALLPSGDLLVSIFGILGLKLIPFGSTEIKDSVYTLSSLGTTGVHVTFNDKVIVGTIGGDSAFPATGPRQIVVMDQTGKSKKIFQYDRHNKPLFTFPYRITSNRKGNIAVVDLQTAEYRGRIVILDQDGNVRNIYTGHPDYNNEDHPFILRGIGNTPSDNFVVADLMEHFLHIIDDDGRVLALYNTAEIGIPFPFSPACYTSGKLYIGGDTYTCTEDKAEIFIVDNFFL